ncbi:MAG: hypothetical protein IPJ07_17195 [Acidobacteria bacterium]|nr:hypothetical protein [Acidobacteriota bacterium]
MYQLNEHLPQVRGMQVLPLSHVYGILIMNLGAMMGSCGRPFARHFDAREVLKTIEELKSRGYPWFRRC